MEDKELENIRKRTEEVSDIIEKIPHRSTRISVLFVMLLAALMIFFGFLIEYPEKVSGPVYITARQAPVRLVANSSGKLHLLKSDSDELSQGEIIGFIETPAKVEDIIRVEASLLIDNPESLFLNPEKFNYSTSLTLGDLSMSYYKFIDALETVTQYRSGKPYEKKLNRLAALLRSQIILNEKNLQQLDARTNTLKIAEKGVHRDSALYQSSAIAEIDLERSYLDYYRILESSQLIEKDSTSIGIQIEDTRYQLQAVLLEQNDTENRLRMNLISTSNQILSDIRKWKLLYCFVSPINGNLEYMNFWRENDFINAGTGVFSVIPSDNPILGQVFLPAIGAGKVKVGQDVIIKLDNYPFIEYGSINGRVKNISQLSSQTTEFSEQAKISSYLVTVVLPSELTTNYGEKLDFRFEIKGVADILTKRRKLMERLFDNLKYIAAKK